MPTCKENGNILFFCLPKLGSLLVTNPTREQIYSLVKFSYLPKPNFTLPLFNRNLNSKNLDMLVGETFCQSVSFNGEDMGAFKIF